MEILSISIDDDTLKQLNDVQKLLGFKSRSKMLRNAILGMTKEYDVLDSLKGNVESVFVLTYDESEKNNVSDILHKFEDAIKTELHQHNSGTCIDVLNIHTDAKMVREIFGTLKRNKSIYSVTYVVIRKTQKAAKK
jgi:CopG family transcriptional regulator, nickel-responsive regulator